MPGTVLITGASSGIGAATALALRDAGFRVFGTTRHPAALPARAPEIEWVGMDVRDETSVRAGIDGVLAAAHRLDGVVCNAGFGIFGSIEEVPLSEARSQFDTNFFGTLATLRYALPALRMSGQGRVVLVGSLAEAVRRALTEATPRFRHAVGREARAVAFARRLLPDRWSVRLLARHFKL